MPKSELEVGARWGHLEVIKEGVERKTKGLGDGCTLTENATVYDARCTCGNVLRIWRDEWKGKKHLRDCGCGVSLDDGATVTMSVSVTLRLRRLIKKRAQEDRISMSRALRGLVELGAAYKDGAGCMGDPASKE